MCGKKNSVEIFNLYPMKIDENTCVIRWNTTLPTHSIIEIDDSEKIEKTDKLKKIHKITLQNLKKDYKYKIQIISIDKKGNKIHKTISFELENLNFSPKIAVYHDTGAVPSSSLSIRRILKKIGVEAYLIDSHDLMKEEINEYDGVIFAGGRAYLMAEKIKNSTPNIRRFVEDGGTFIGICAGAYLASNVVNWEGIRYDRDVGYILSLFEGEAVGPIKEIIDYDLDKYLNPYKITDIDILEDHPIKNYSIVYWGGSYFNIPDDSKQDVKVIAEYPIIKKPAIIRFKYGHGKVLLIGPHPELIFDSNDSLLSNFIETQLKSLIS